MEKEKLPRNTVACVAERRQKGRHRPASADTHKGVWHELRRADDERQPDQAPRKLPRNRRCCNKPNAHHPDWLATFAHRAAAQIEPNSTNPTFRTALYKLLELPVLHCRRAELSLAGHLIFAAVVVAASVKRIVSNGLARDRRALILAAKVVYALAMPRFKAYSYALVLPAALQLVTTCTAPPWLLMALIVVLTAVQRGTFLYLVNGLGAWCALVTLWGLWLAGYARFGPEQKAATSPPR